MAKKVNTIMRVVRFVLGVRNWGGGVGNGKRDGNVGRMVCVGPSFSGGGFFWGVVKREWYGVY